MDERETSNTGPTQQRAFLPRRIVRHRSTTIRQGSAPPTLDHEATPARDPGRSTAVMEISNEGPKQQRAFLPRRIVSHRPAGVRHQSVPPTLDELIDITAVDPPGAGGAHHHYVVDLLPSYRLAQERFHIFFQCGPLIETGVNGISCEALLAIVADRLECFQTGPFPCEENQQALECVIVALQSLHKRTQQRQQRAVEGTNQT